MFTDRRGGVSRGRYASANLGDTVGDDPDAVERNRRLLAGALATGPGVPADPDRWVWLAQVHGATVARAEAALERRPEADAAVTAARGLPVVVVTADCAPVALAAPAGVAVVHAGWRGLVAGIVEAAVDALGGAGGDVRALIGPCIRVERYEFGEADLRAVVDVYGPAVAQRTAGGTPALDLAAAVGEALRRSGVAAVADVGTCTASSPDHFSYRRDLVTGRQATLITRP